MSKLIVLDLHQSIAPQIPEASTLVGRGGLVIIPTDTYYALGADPFQPAAVERIFSLKGRAPEKPILVLISEMDQAERCALVNVEYFDQLTEAFWPGPLTIILPGIESLPSRLTAGTGKIGLRLPGSPMAREIVRECGGALTGTSANLSGEKDPSLIEMIADRVLQAVDLVIDAGATPGQAPSTLIDLTGPTPEILRHGAIPQADLEKVLGFRLPETRGHETCVPQPARSSGGGSLPVPRTETKR